MEPSRGAPANVVLNFHKGDQHAAAILMELLSTLDEGRPVRYYIQYGNDPATLGCHSALLRFMNQKDAVFSYELPNIEVPQEFLDQDPNQGPFEGNCATRTPGQKKSIFRWNLCVYKYIQLLDRFLMIEPDCVMFKHGWLKDILDAAEKDEGPIFGHAKTGLINGRQVVTHWAGCSVYNGKVLRALAIEKWFEKRFDNPWWPLRNLPETQTANNAFYGPVFSAYDISFDYFLFALYWMEKTGSDNPLNWPTDQIASRQDLIFCDFKTKLSTGQIISQFLNKLPLMHGVKNDDARIEVIRHFGIPADTSPYPVGGPGDSIVGQNDKPWAISDLKNRFVGKRCFIICNGPSLNKTDLTLLKNEYTIGLNRIYLNYDKMGFEPTFLCTVNPHVLRQFADDFSKLKSLKFFRAETRSKLSNHRNTYYMESVGVHEFVADFDHQQWCEGCTVTYCAMQLAFYLGFETVILLGADHFFGDSGTPHKLVEAQSKDVNHFHPDYFGKGVKWQYPDLERSEISYRNAKKAFENAGRIILDATVDGHLTIFQKVDYLTAAANPKALKTYLTHYDNGMIALSEGRLDIAKASFEKSADLAPDFPAVRSHLATLFWQAKNPKLALQHITQALQIAPSHKGTILNCAQILQQAGNKESALKLCRTFLDKNKTDDEDIRSMIRQLVG
jgi:tetratricopeptide (TPR) repeat protein